MWVPSPLRPFINDTRYVVAYYPFYRRGFHEGTTAFTLCRWAFVVLWIIYFLLQVFLEFFWNGKCKWN